MRPSRASTADNEMDNEFIDLCRTATGNYDYYFKTSNRYFWAHVACSTLYSMIGGVLVSSFVIVPLAPEPVMKYMYEAMAKRPVVTTLAIMVPTSVFLLDKVFLELTLDERSKRYGVVAQEFNHWRMDAESLSAKYGGKIPLDKRSAHIDKLVEVNQKIRDLPSSICDSPYRWTFE